MKLFSICPSFSALKRPIAFCAFLLPVVIALIITFIPLTGGFAQSENPQPPTDDEVNAVAKDLYCPVCENTPLDVCPTQACEEWRQLIYDKLALGWNEDQIKVYFVEQYGDRVLAAPPARGLNWLVYIIPPLLFVAGIAVLYTVIRTWKKPTEANSDLDETPLTGVGSSEYVQRLEEDLKKL